MLKRNLIVCGVAALFAGGVAVARSGQDPMAVIGNVFLQDATPGAPQVGHAAILGTFRAGRVAVTQLNEAGAAVIGNNNSGLQQNIGGSFSSDGNFGIGLRGTNSGPTFGTGVYGESRASSGIGVSGRGHIGLKGFGGVVGVTCSGEQNGIIATGSQSATGNGGTFYAGGSAGYGIVVRNNGGVAALLDGGFKQSSGDFLLTSFAPEGGVSMSALKLLEANGALMEFFASPTNSYGGRTRLSSKLLANGRRGSSLRLEGASQTPNISYLSSWEAQADGQFLFKAHTIQASVKNFVEIDPTDVTKDIVYACVEGPEAAAYVRGTGKLVNGRAVVSLPEHFQKVAVSAGMTVQVTPRSFDSKGLATGTRSVASFEVGELNGGRGNYEFDWEVKAVRRGYEDYRVVRKYDEEITDRAERAEALAMRQATLDLKRKQGP